MEVKDQFQMPSTVAFCFIFETRSVTELRASQLWQVGWTEIFRDPSLSTLLVLSYKREPQNLVSYVGAEDLNSIFRSGQKTLYWLNHLPRSQSPFYKCARHSYDWNIPYSPCVKDLTLRGVFLKGTLQCSLHVLPLFLVPAVTWMVLHHSVLYNSLYCHRSKTSRTNYLWARTCKACKQNKPLFFLSWLSHVFDTPTGSWITLACQRRALELASETDINCNWTLVCNGSTSNFMFTWKFCVQSKLHNTEFWLSPPG